MTISANYLNSLTLDSFNVSNNFPEEYNHYKTILGLNGYTDFILYHFPTNLIYVFQHYIYFRIIPNYNIKYILTSDLIASNNIYIFVFFYLVSLYYIICLVRKYTHPIKAESSFLWNF